MKVTKVSTLFCMSFAAILGVASVALPSYAAEVKITWKDPESFSDVRPSNESRVRFRERTLSELEAHIVELGSALPQDQVLTMIVTNVDLAGEVWPSQFVGFGNSGASDIRVIKRIDIPRMSFSYTLSDAAGKVIASEEDVKLKDMDFMESGIRRYRSESLSYEKAMLDDWFADTFAKQVVSTH
ncbi:DUF3016 domain-containing protein [Alteromonas sp. D210916BOD_24]|uniref:DUF3016 domain-containing protein n=1 Tax=Alteromonas sp. D210916BOD_24 TaxID=3157618 RepID=UPI00399D5581